MKAGWADRRLEDLTFIQEGPGIRKYEYEDDGFPMINVRCVQDGYIDMSSARAANNDLATGKWKHFQCAEGDILFTISGTIGRCAIVQAHDLPLLMNTSVVRFRPTSPVLDAQFLYYFLQSDGFQAPLEDLSSGTAIKNVGPTHIKTLSIPLPPLDEQKRIVEVLDAAFEGLTRARAHTEANLQNARELFGTTIQSLLDHETDDPATVQTSLGEVCEIYSGAGFPDKYQGHASGDFPFFKVGDMNKEGNEVALQAANNYVSDEVRKVLGAKIFKPDSIVFPKVGGAIATNKKRKIVVPSCVDNNVMGLWPIPERIDAEYLSWWLQGFDIYEFSNKAALPSITKATVSDWPLVLPPKKRQKEIAAELQVLWQQTEDLQSHYRAKLADLDDLRQSLLQKAFAGELT